MAKSYLNSTAVPTRGLRNNNPGNLRRADIAWQGKVPFSMSKDASFEQFYELRYGIRAMMKDIYSDYKNGKNTVTKLINEYAPANENNTLSYINSVATAVGVSATAVFELTADSLIAIAKIIAVVENGLTGAAYISAADYDAAFAISGIPLKKKKTA